MKYILEKSVAASVFGRFGNKLDWLTVGTFSGLSDLFSELDDINTFTGVIVSPGNDAEIIDEGPTEIILVVGAAGVTLGAVVLRCLVNPGMKD